MCKWGNNINTLVSIPSSLSHTGEEYQKEVSIDECIAPLVKSLNDIGWKTICSCCGHGQYPGQIDLVDGRVICIFSPEQWQEENLQ